MIEPQRLFRVGLAVLAVVGLLYAAEFLFFTPDAPKPAPASSAAESVVSAEEPPSTALDSVGACSRLRVDAGALRRELGVDSAVLRTGPGGSFPRHESGVLYRGESLQVLQECDGWAQARVLTVGQARPIIASRGIEEATADLTFWLEAQALSP